MRLLLFCAFVGLSTQAAVLPISNDGALLDDSAKNIQLTITKPHKFFWPEKFPSFHLPSLQWPQIPVLSDIWQKMPKPSQIFPQLRPAGSEAISCQGAVAGGVFADEPVGAETVAQSVAEPAVEDQSVVEPEKQEVVNDVPVEPVEPVEPVQPAEAESRSVRLPVTTRPPGVPHHDDTLGPVQVSPIIDPLVPVPYLTVPLLAPSSWLKFFI